MITYYSWLEELGTFEKGQTDDSFKIMKYVKLVSLVKGVKIVTPVLEFNLHIERRHYNIITAAVLNVTSSPITISREENAIGGLVCQAAKLSGKDSSRHRELR